MTKANSLFFALAMASAAAVGAGCSNDNEGTLRQTWTIGGSTSPNSCALVGASQMRVVVLDAQLFIQATQFAPCSDFSTSLALDDNTYTASATFLDANGTAVSETRAISIFTIVEGQTTTVNIDFPLAAFL